MLPVGIYGQTNAAVTPTTQQQTIEKRNLIGTITDASTGEVLVGVTVQVKESSVGTMTDANGKFSIAVTSNTELQFSYVGYKTQTLLVGELGVMSVKMESDDELLDEVVVIGAGTQKKVSVTGSITTVKGSTLKAPSSSLTSALAGKLSGIISVNNSGEPGSVSEFYIRGINTFGGLATPLILLDGVEISSTDLNRIPAETIESFSLLKDASATAIYGNRGANGVMLVTTKSGEENMKTRVNVSLETSYFKPMNRVEFADGATYMRTYNEALQARSSQPITNPRYTEEQIQHTANGVNPYVYPDVDWYDIIFKDGNYNQRANINVQGGGSRVTYFMSLQANHDAGLLNAREDYYYDSNINNWEYNFQNNISYKLTNTTTVNLRMMAQIGNQQGPNYSTSDLYNITMQANPVAFPAYFPEQEDDRGFIRFGNAEIKSGVNGQNPYAYLMSSFRETNYNTLNTSVSLNQNFGFITEGLSAKALVNFKNWAYSAYNRWITPYFYKVKSNSYDPETGKYDLELLQPGNDYVSQSDISRNADQTFYLDARIDWKRSFGSHNASAMLMYLMREYRNGILPNRNQGYSGRATYDYDNRYLLEFNFGYNGSERLADGYRFEFFPAASIGWVASSEDFWEQASRYVNHLKFRASYGLVGSDAFDSSAPHFLYQNNIGIGTAHSYWTGLPSSEVSKSGPGFYVLAVQDAGWEHVKKFNIGVDFSLLRQVNLTLDYFRDHRDRILMSRASWPNMLGYWGSRPWSNIGEVKNHGVEVSASWSKQFGEDWRVDLRANLTYNQNEYVYVDEPDYPYVWQTLTGKPLGTLTGYVSDGLFESEEEIASWYDQSMLGSNIRPGDIKYRDINGDGAITTEDMVVLSPYNYIPRVQYGFGLNVIYKNLDFGVFFNGSAKRSIMINSGFAPFLLAGGDGIDNETLERNLMQWIADGHWSEANPNPNATYPRLGTSSAEIANNIEPSSFWVRDGSFLRFKTLEVGYRFQYCRLYFSGDNLAVFSPFKLWDPELAWNAYPLQRTFNLGVQLTL
ncbi:MAG: TonB-dependent receptor [Prevotellaceae bacterium]|jgi:TonB-linked SusC/RagA family outer membrane protein|nr:TonB-dependent receptor [Prevotellaceae bacterium]